MIERGNLKDIGEQPAISPVNLPKNPTLLFLCAFAPLRLCVKPKSMSIRGSVSRKEAKEQRSKEK
jgi:hypothetical protein